MSHKSRSSAAQFFMETEDGDNEGHGRRSSGRYGSDRRGSSSSFSETTSPTKAAETPNDYNEESKVAEYLSKATVTTNEKVKLDYLRKVTEIVVRRQPSLLDNFLDEILNFQSDENSDVRVYILEFIEEACQVDPEIIPKVLHNMMLMLQDRKVTVQKRSIQVIAKLYKFTLIWLCKSKFVTEDMEGAWVAVNELKKYISKLLDSDLDGIRTYTVKFIETVILVQTPTEHDSIKRPNEFCLDNVPITVKVARPRKLEEDARLLFDELLKFHGSRHATSVNLMACMGSIVLIAKLRPQFMGRVVTAIEKLNAILPPTLEKSQVTSVRKHMKLQLIGLLRHPRAIEFYDGITTLLTDLGATSQELHKSISNYDEIRAERRKRQRALAEREEHNIRKKAKLTYEEKTSVPLDEESDDEEDMDKPIEEPSKSKDEMTDMEKLVFNSLTPSVAADFVLSFMDRLPESMPAHFMASYTPIAIAGTDSQVKHVARLLAAQITASQLGPAAALQVEEQKDEPTTIPTLVSSATITQEPKKSLFSTIPQATTIKKKIPKPVKLNEITKPLKPEEKQRFVLSATRRILQTGEQLNDIKCRLISSIAVSSSFELRYFIMTYIKEDIRNRLDLAINWIFAEYCMIQDFISRAVPVVHDNATERYAWTFYNVMKAILDFSPESDKSHLACRLYSDSPMIPDKGVELLKSLCGQVAHSSRGMQLLMDLATNRPRKLNYLSALLEFCSHANEEIRANGVSCVLQLYTRAKAMKAVIEDKAIQAYLNSLRYPEPPEILFTEELGRKEYMHEWSEDLVKACLHLYLQLLVVKNSLIHELAKVYVETTGDVKRNILRYIESPIRKMGMDSPDLMALLDTFPKGAETLITRIIHILTDKTLPSVDLVSRVRNLYAKRVSDVRFLIPVLNGLSKSEILSALPKLIKLNPNVVKEVFNRLLGTHVDSESQHASPVTPVELMVALHRIEPSKCDVKTVIKATSLCFNESDVFTAEVLAIVINQLLEVSPLPTLLMRTVIQTLALHPKLSGFIMNTLSRLLNKQIWTQPKVWEGFIKCCQRTIPKSIPILLTLPPPQLKQALESAPDLKQPLVSHLMSFTPQQRSCMPPSLLSTVLGDSQDEYGVEGEGPYFGQYQRSDESGYGRIVKEEPGSPRRSDGILEVKEEPLEDMSKA